MKKTNGKKLELKLETVAPLLLDDVNGGQLTSRLTPPITRHICTKVSQLVCPPSLGRACAGGGGQGGE